MEVKELIRKHAVETRREIKIVKNDMEKVKAICESIIPIFTNGPELLTDGPTQIDGLLNMMDLLNLMGQVKELYMRAIHSQRKILIKTKNKW